MVRCWTIPPTSFCWRKQQNTSRAQQFHGCLKKSVSLAILLQMLNCFSPKVEMKRRVLARGGALHYARGPICASGSKSLWSEGNCFQSSVLPSLPSALQQDICYARQWCTSSEQDRASESLLPLSPEEIKAPMTLFNKTTSAVVPREVFAEVITQMPETEDHFLTEQQWSSSVRKGVTDILNPF